MISIVPIPAYMCYPMLLVVDHENQDHSTPCHEDAPKSAQMTPDGYREGEEDERSKKEEVPGGEGALRRKVRCFRLGPVEEFLVQELMPVD